MLTSRGHGYPLLEGRRPSRPRIVADLHCEVGERDDDPDSAYEVANVPESFEHCRSAPPPNGYAVQLRQPAADRCAEGKMTDARRLPNSETRGWLVSAATASWAATRDS